MPVLDSLTRRDFVRTSIATSLATGFALAVQPIAEATTIHTDDKGLIAGEVKVTAADGVSIPAYRAYPDKPNATFPVVIVIQEIFGVHEHIKDMCRRFAKDGYFAISSELYARQGDVSQLESIQDVMKVVSKVPDAQVASDLDATLAYAKSTGKADASKLAVTGFCWGGRQTWLYCIHNPQVKAGGAWYGPLAGRPNELQPKTVIDALPGLTVPVLGQYGGKDAGITAESRDEASKILAAGKSGSEIVVYPDAGHGFNADYRPSYNAADAKAAYAKLLAWFKAHGAA